jgi:hypothetical protein
MPSFLGEVVFVNGPHFSPNLSRITFHSVYPSKMTAFGFKNDPENKLAKSRMLLGARSTKRPPC